MNTNKKIIIVSLVLVALAFYGGMKYGQSIRATMNFALRNGNFANGQFTGRGTRTNGGGAIGEIISKDASGVTLKMQDGGSKIILLSTGTTISKMVTGTKDDLVVGKLISVMGTANSDGSITAESVQLRQATTTLMR